MSAPLKPPKSHDLTVQLNQSVQKLSLTVDYVVFHIFYSDSVSIRVMLLQPKIIIFCEITLPSFPLPLMLMRVFFVCWED